MAYSKNLEFNSAEAKLKKLLNWIGYIIPYHFPIVNVPEVKLKSLFAVRQ